MRLPTYTLPLLCLPSLFAQPAISLAGASVSTPPPPEVAPGQVAILQFRGVKPSADGALRSARVTADTLPNTLAGLTPTLRLGDRALPIPVFSVAQKNECGAGQTLNPACILTTVRVQIPFELGQQGQDTPGGQPSLPPPLTLVLDVDGASGGPFPLQAAVSNAHVLTNCDVDSAPPANGECSRVAFHANGRKVTAADPAQRGEAVIVYALGLGPVWPAVASGKPAPEGAVIPHSGVLRVWISLRDQPLNASGSAPRFLDPNASMLPGPGLEYVGLVPGQIGLYQLNVRIPDSFEPVLPCGPEVHANALLLVTTRQGSDTVPFCVAK